MVPFSGIFPQAFGTELHTSGTFRFGNRAKEGKKRAEGVGFSYPKAKSYTPSYTRNYKVLLGFPIPGVGNVGDFQKTFFMGGRKNVETSSTRRRTGIPKHRTSLGKSTDVLHQKYGCLPQRSPMFLFSGKGAVKAGSR